MRSVRKWNSLHVLMSLGIPCNVCSVLSNLQVVCVLYEAKSPSPLFANTTECKTLKACRLSTTWHYMFSLWQSLVVFT